MKSLRLSIGISLVLGLASSAPVAAALQRFSLTRIPISLTREGFGPTGFGIFGFGGGVLTQIARLGEAAPGGIGSYASFVDLRYGASGHVAFRADLSGTPGGTNDDEVIVRGDGAALAIIAREGQLAPGGGTFTNLRALAVDSAGNVYFSATLLGAGIGIGNDSGVFRGDGLSLAVIAREGESAFGGSELTGEVAGTSPSVFSGTPGSAALNIPLTGSGVTPVNDGALIRSDGATRVRLARRGDPYPGTGVLEIARFPLGGDAAGWVAFPIRVGFTDYRLVRGNGGSLQQIAATSDALAGSTLSQLVNYDVGAVNASGQILFWSLLADGRETLLLHTPGSGTSITAVTGQALPGGGTLDARGSFTAFVDPVLDDAGRVLFRVALTGSATGGTQALLIWQAGALSELVRSGDAAPGGGTFAGIGAHSRLDALGRVLFEATVTGAPPDANQRIFRSEAGSIVELLSEGVAAPNGDGVVWFDSHSSPELQNTSAGVLFSAEIDASAAAPPPIASSFRCRNAPSPPGYHCGPHEGGVVLIEDAAPAPRLRALRVLSDTTVTFYSSEVDLFLSQRSREGPAPGQSGVGSTSSSIRWGTVSGWALTGRIWCQAYPGIVCSFLEAMNRETVSLSATSDFYDLGTWFFHGTGFVATPYLISRSESGNTQLRLRGRQAQNGVVPALPIAGIALLAGALLVASRSAISRSSD